MPCFDQDPKNILSSFIQEQLSGELPFSQEAKIKCGKAHFEALQKDGIIFKAPIASYDRFDDMVNSQM